MLYYTMSMSDIAPQINMVCTLDYQGLAVQARHSLLEIILQNMHFEVTLVLFIRYSSVTVWCLVLASDSMLSKYRNLGNQMKYIKLFRFFSRVFVT